MDPLATAQQAFADFQAGHDDYVAKFKPSVEALDPGWQQKAETAYNTELSRLQHEVDYQQTAAGTAAKNAANAPKVDAQAADAAALTAERKANQAKGLGYVTNAEAASADATNKRIGLAGQQVDIANQRTAIAQQQADLAAREAAIRDQLAQHKIDLTTAMDQLRLLQAEREAAARDQTNQVNLYGHEVTARGQDQAAATADQTAADTLIDSQKLMPAGAVTNGGGFNITANAVPMSQYSDMATFIAHSVANARAAQLGPAPTPPMLNSGSYPPPTVPGAAPASAGPTPPAPPPATPPAANWGPGNPDYDRQLLLAQQGVSGSTQAPQFTAPAAVGGS